MIVLFVVSLLLVFISLGLGALLQHALSRFFKTEIKSDTPGLLLSGLMFSAVYFNIVSFFIAINFLTLVPLFIISCIIWWKYQLLHHIKQVGKSNVNFYFSKSHWFYTVALLIVLFIYWLVPPLNVDSAGYHYASILWYEKYKVVPGLANLHGRYAFNPAAFIISAAYSFTDVFKQSIYPLNGVICATFLLWMLKKILSAGNNLIAIIFLVTLFIFARPMLANMPSPSSEPLMIICLGYAIFKILAAIQKEAVTVSNILIPCLLILFSITAKLSAAPGFLFIGIVFFLLSKEERKPGLALKSIFIALIIFIPWISRNLVLSGYPFYPLPYFNIFSFDWKAPYDVLLLDYTYAKYFPNFFPYLLYKLKALSFFEWLFIWMKEHLNYGRQLDLVILLSALLSPVYWILKRKGWTIIHKQLFAVWLIAYACVWIWLANAPEYRFGVVYHALAFSIPFIALISPQVKLNYIRYVLPVMLWIISIYYIVHVLQKESTYSFAIKDFWLYPLKDKRYKNVDTLTYNYTMLDEKTKLYYEDPAHECINVGLPCMPWKYGKIEMRGTNLGDGFRNVTNEVRKYYPFLNDNYKFDMHR